MTMVPSGSWNPVWEEIFRKREWGKYPPEHVVRFVAHNWYAVRDRQLVRLLDVGAGPGANTWFMAREGFSASAIDGSSTAIERLHTRLASEGLKADARVGDFKQLPWEDGIFDGAIDNLAICTNPFESCRRVVHEVHRVLKPGGRFLSASFTPRTWGYGTGKQVEKNGFDDLSEGPCSGEGFCLFMDRQQVDELYGDFAEVRVDTTSATLDGETRVVEHWIVSCRK